MANRITTTFDFKERGSGLKKIKADVEGVDGAWNKAKTSAKSAYAEFAGSRAAQAAVAGLAIKIGKDAVQAASNLEESLNAVNVTYGTAADEVRKLGETSAESFGLSQRAFNEFAVQFSSFAQNIAQNDGRAVADVVQEMTMRASDFASVMNLDVSEAARVFQSALAGETEPIKKFGIDMSAAAVEAYALANGLAESKSEIDESIKVQARYGLLLESTAQMSGDFKNTQDGLANSTKTLTAQYEDLQAELGQVLLPAVADTTATLVDLAHVTGQVIDQVELLGDKLPGGKVGEFAKMMSGLGLVESAVTKPLEGLSWALDKVGVSSEDSAYNADAATRAYWANSYAAGRLADTTEDVGAAAGTTASAIGDQERAAWASALANERLADRQEAAAEATERHRAAVAALFDEVNKNLSSMFDYEDATLALESANADYVKALEDAGPAEERSEQTKRDLRQSEIDLATQALNTAAAYAESQGAIEGTTEFAAAQRAELDRLAGQFPELRDEIAQFVAELDRIPAVKTVSLVLQRNSVNSQLQRTTGGSVRVDEFGNLKSVGVGATGGVVTRPTLSLIGEAGPEAVVPLNKMPGAAPLPPMAGGGGNVYNISVTAPAGADADAFGRAVREAIRRETRWSGPVTGWSAA